MSEEKEKQQATWLAALLTPRLLKLLAAASGLAALVASGNPGTGALALPSSPRGPSGGHRSDTLAATDSLGRVGDIRLVSAGVLPI